MATKRLTVAADSRRSRKASSHGSVPECTADDIHSGKANAKTQLVSYRFRSCVIPFFFGC